MMGKAPCSFAVPHQTKRDSMVTQPPRALRPAAYLLLACLPGVALAVDTVSDLPGPAAGNESDLPSSSSPWGATSEARLWTAQLGWVRRPFWGITRLDDCTGSNCATEGPLLSSLTYMHLGGQQGLSPRITVGGATLLQLFGSAAVPSLEAAVPDLGRPRVMDLHAFGRVTLLETPRTAVAVVPWVTMDGSILGAEGNGHSLVGASTSLAGRMVWGVRSNSVTSTSVPIWTTIAEVGVRSTLGLDRDGPIGTRQRIKLEGRLGGSYMVTPTIAAMGELQLQQTEVESIPYFGTELRAGARHRLTERLEVSGMLGWAPTRAPGDAHPRLVMGTRWLPKQIDNSIEGSSNAVTLQVVDLQGWPVLATVSDSSRTVLPSPPGLPGETRASLPTATSNVWVTAPGKATRQLIDVRNRPTAQDVILPPAGGNGLLWLRIVDLDGLPMERARVRLNGENLGMVESDGSIRIEGLSSTLAEIQVAAPGFERRYVRVQVAPVTEQSKPERIQLRPPIGQVTVEVNGPSGPLPKAQVSILSPVADSRTLALNDNGSGTTILLPGRNLLRVEHPGFGAQEIEVDISPTRIRSETVRFTMRPAVKDGGTIEMIVTDTDGSAVEAARVLVKGQELGRTASGGVFRIEAMETGALPVEVTAEGFRSYDTVDVMVEEKSSSEVIAPMSWEAGSVRVLATGPEGPVPDTVVRFAGPESVDSRRVRGDGFLDIQLSEGSWTLTIDAPGHDAQERTIEVRADDTHLEVVEAVLLLEDPEPDVRLELTVLDEDGSPVRKARVTANGQFLGTSSQTGQLLVDGLSPGPVELVVQSPLHAVTSASIRLREGATAKQSVTLNPKPGIVRIHAESAGEPIDAFLRVLGPRVYPSVRLGPDGVREVPLLPGEWQLVLSHERFVIETLDVEIPEGGGPPQDLYWKPEGTQYGAILGLGRVPLTIRTLQSADDRPLDSSVRLLGPVVMPSQNTGPDGELVLDVRPGAWEVIASAPNTAIVGATADVGTDEKVAPVVLRLGAARVAVGDVDVVLNEVVEFETGSAQLLPLSWGLLDEVAHTLQVNPGLVRLAIEGHTDNTGTDTVNRRLSLARAEAVRSYLVAQGISPSRLKAEGYGSSMPVADNATDAGRTANRRVAFRIIDQSEAPVALSASSTTP
ncbi:MAG TPA: hypothetical protein DFR83_06570 [Deltaproteobacteria bacterium]|nr:hypothetical protein [Deltaproteobacteria bacterium]